MKKILTFSLLLCSLLILVNCSPKTAKQTAASKAPTQKQDDAAAVINSEVEMVKPAQEVELQPVPAETKATTPLAELSMDQQLAMYKDMAPLRAEIGKKLFMTRCNKCHGYNMPETQSADNWIKIMTKMGPRAHLNTDEYLELTGYVVQNAKK